MEIVRIYWPIESLDTRLVLGAWVDRGSIELREVQSAPRQLREPACGHAGIVGEIMG